MYHVKNMHDSITFEGSVEWQMSHLRGCELAIVIDKLSWDESDGIVTQLGPLGHAHPPAPVHRVVDAKGLHVEVGLALLSPLGVHLLVPVGGGVDGLLHKVRYLILLHRHSVVLS